MSTNHDESDLVEQLRSAYSALEPTGREPDVAARALTSARGAKRRAAVTQSAVALALVGVVAGGATFMHPRAESQMAQGPRRPVAMAPGAASTSTGSPTASATISGDPAAGLTPTPGPTLSAGVPTSTSTTPLTGATATPPTVLGAGSGRCHFPARSDGLFGRLNGSNVLPTNGEVPKHLVYYSASQEQPTVSRQMPCLNSGFILGTLDNGGTLPKDADSDWGIEEQLLPPGPLSNQMSSGVNIVVAHYATADDLRRALALADDPKGPRPYKSDLTTVPYPGGPKPGYFMKHSTYNGLNSYVAYRVMGEFIVQVETDDFPSGGKQAAAQLVDVIAGKLEAQGVKG